MARFLYHDFTHSSRKAPMVGLASALLGGMFLGCVIFHLAEFHCHSLMLGAADSSVSIVGLLSVILLPYLLTAFAVYLCRPWMVLPIAFCKGCSFMVVSLGVHSAFGSAGWLMRLLLMFSDLLSMPLLVSFWLVYIRRKHIPARMILCYFALAVAIGSLDYCFISPLLANL